MAIKPNNEIEIKNSIGSIYEDLAKRRAEDRLKRKEEKEQKKLQKEEAKEAKAKKSKKERLLDTENAYKDILKNITGEDIDYVEPKKKGKWKFKKWMLDEDDELLVKKPKKKKKKDYRKEFGPELSMLKSLIADNNRFTNELLKKFNLITKDGQINKTAVDLAANIVSSRSTSLNILKEIGGIKKTLADLYYKELKAQMDAANASGKFSKEEDENITLGGAKVFESMFGGNINSGAAIDTNPFVTPGGPQELTPVPDIATPGIQPQAEVPPSSGIADFDPSTWNRNDLLTGHAKFENIPHTLVCEWDRENNRARFKAVRNDTGEELIGYPVPQMDPSKLTFDTDNMTVKGEFEDIYKLIIL